MDALRTLAGRYALVEVIGRGGMGTVYRGEDLVLGRTVAVKVLPLEFAEGDPVTVARFEREARAAASLADPSIVKVYDTGADDGTRFIVMEHVAGRSVEAILREERRLSPQRAVEIAIGVAGALGTAHAAGIVHRDVKPANVMVADDGSVRVLDFGIARALDGTALTHTAAVVGTAAYMAPEQVLGQPADERSDIYSLGCVLYAMVSGRPPFVGETVAAILHQQVNAEPESLRDGDARVPPALDALVTELLAKSPDARPQSAREVRDRLALLEPRGKLGAVGGAPPTALLPRGPGPTDTRPLPRRGWRPTRSRLGALAAGTAGLAVVAAVIALLASGGSPRSTSKTHHSTGSKRPAPSHHSAAATSTPAQTTPTTATTATTPPASTSTPTATTPISPAESTVAGSAGALTTLLTRDVEGHTIEQHAAQQIGNELTNVLNSYEMGHTMNLPHELANLSKQVEMLEQHGEITAAAAPPLDASLANLQAAIARSDPAVDTTQGAAGAPAGGATPPAAGDGPAPGMTIGKVPHGHGHHK